MKQFENGFVGNRVLRLNVGHLIAAGPGHSQEVTFDVPAIRIAKDVDAVYMHGDLRLSRTKEGILVQGDLALGIEDECYRCLEPVPREHRFDVEELYAYPAPIGAGEYVLADDGVLDLAPLVRAEMIIGDNERVLCQPDCKGMCENCGVNRNVEACTCEDETIDPRFAALRSLLDAQ